MENKIKKSHIVKFLLISVALILFKVPFLMSLGIIILWVVVEHIINTHFDKDSE